MSCSRGQTECKEVERKVPCDPGAIDNDSYALIKWSVFLDGANAHMKMPPRGLPDKPTELQGIKDVWQELEKLQAGDVPLGRCNHTATLVGSSILVLFGGWQGLTLVHSLGSTLAFVDELSLPQTSK